MKKEITYVSQDAVLSVIAERGLPVLEQKGWLKVTCAPGRLVYVAKTKRVGRINLSGFEHDRGTVDLGGESFGTVRQIVDMARPEADILLALGELLDHASRLPAREKAPARERVSTKARAPGADTKAERKALIMRVAAEKGAPVSEEVLAICEEDGEEAGELVDADVAEEAGLLAAE